MGWRDQLIKSGVPARTVDKFLQVHDDHPEVWKAFERVTLSTIARGKKAGAKTIAEWVRYEVEILAGGSDYKINNNYTAYYARIFALKYPQHRDFFEFREVKGIAA